MTGLMTTEGALAELPPVPSYAQIRALEREILKHPQAECPVAHHFADGICMREMFASAGTVIVGKMHRHSTLNVLLTGRLRVTDEDGAVRELVAPHVYATPAGCKKVAYVLEDILWLNPLPTRLKDPAAIEAKFVAPETPMIEESP